MGYILVYHCASISFAQFPIQSENSRYYLNKLDKIRVQVILLMIVLIVIIIVSSSPRPIFDQCQGRVTYIAHRPLFIEIYSWNAIGRWHQALSFMSIIHADYVSLSLSLSGRTVNVVPVSFLMVSMSCPSLSRIWRTEEVVFYQIKWSIIGGNAMGQSLQLKQ